MVEIYHPEDEDSSRLLLQITAFNDLKGRDVISIDSGIAAMFNLKTYNDVLMRVVNASDVALDSIEITFKDQYMGRSEMWRLKTYLVLILKFMSVPMLKIFFSFRQIHAFISIKKLITMIC